MAAVRWAKQTYLSNVSRSRDGDPLANPVLTPGVLEHVTV